MRVRSPEDAAEQVRWPYESAGAPCPPGCGVRARRHEIERVPGARAVEVSAERRMQLGAPFQSRFAVFADGAFLCMVYAYGRPTTTPSGEFAEASTALFRRVAGEPLPE
ncbi:MAG: hypothetical protein ICV64_08595 [Thermoleophilia bacterium]|nr:hypothetical protein [Thermoleophilia bacterium]